MTNKQELPTVAKEGLGDHHALWTDVKCGQLVANQEPVIIDSKSTVEQAAEILVTKGISSAPVFNAETKTFTGMFDYRDLVSYLLIVFHKNKWKEEEADVEIKEIVRRAQSLEPVQVKLVSDLSRRNPFYSVTPETSLLQAMDVFSKGIHRVAVIDEATGAIKGILTQSNVVDFLLSKAKDVPSTLKTLKELGIGGQRDIVSVPAESNVFAAMERMTELGLSSVPLVDRGNRLVGSISLSDVKYVLRGFKYNLLWRSCFQFISHVRNRQGLIEDQGRDRYPVFEVREGDTLAKAAGKIRATRSHRVWVVDGDNKVVGVVSLTDVLKALLPSDASV